MNWVRHWKKRIGYYEARRAYLRGPFSRALRPSDAFLVGHPKSGNTWLAYMVAMLQMPDRIEEINLKNVGEFVPFVHGRDDRIRRHPKLPDPRLFRNENPQYPDLYPRTIYLVRDPRAALVSFWRMYQVMFNDQTLSLESFIDQYMSMDRTFDTWNSKLERWDRQVGQYLKRAGSDGRLLVIRYEDMIDDREHALGQVSAFLNLASGPDDIRRVAERGSFDAMRRIEDRFGAEAYAGKAKGHGKFVRHGTADGWRSEMAATVAGRIESEFGPAMKLAGYL